MSVINVNGSPFTRIEMHFSSPRPDTRSVVRIFVGQVCSIIFHINLLLLLLNTAWYISFSFKFFICLFRFIE
jgi:hypothetical protein